LHDICGVRRVDFRFSVSCRNVEIIISGVSEGAIKQKVAGLVKKRFISSLDESIRPVCPVRYYSRRGGFILL